VIRFVIDASVAVKWVLIESHTEPARRIVRTRKLLAPDLLWAELGSVVWARRRRGEFGHLYAREMLAELRALPIRTYPLLPLLPAAVDVAMAVDHSVYDCLYLALAEAEDCRVVTADRRFHRSVGGGVWADRIVWIEDVT
jgi:predicted nucleic acid-binding protein